MLPPEQRIAEMHRRLESAFQPTELEIIDDGHKHIGHEGSRHGHGHYTVRIRSERFRGMAPLAQHRAIYAALGELMTTDIHALSIQSGLP